MTLRELIVKFGFDIDFTKLESMGRAIDKQKKSLEKMTDSMEEIGGKMSLWVTTPLLAAATLSANAAADMQDSLQKVEIVFGSVGAKARETADEISKSLGQSQEGSAEMLARLGMGLQGLGIGEERALDMSDALARLAVDIKHFANSNMSVQEVADSLTRGMLGSQRGLLQFGIKIGETELKTRMLALAQGELKGQTEEQIKAFATYQLILEKTRKIQGEYERSQGELGRATDDFKNGVKDTASSFGKILLPFFVKAISLGTKFVNFLKGTSESTKKFLIIIASIVGVIGPVLLGLAGLITTVLALASAATTLAAKLGLAKLGFSALSLASLKLVAIWGVLLGFIFLLFDDLVNFAGGEKSVLGDLAEWFSILDEKTAAWVSSLGALGRAALWIVTGPFRLLFSSVRAIGGALGAIMSGEFGLLKDVGKEFLSNLITDPMIAPSAQSMLGFGPTTAGVNAMKQNATTNNVSAPITINVPPNTPPEQVGPFVAQSFRDSLDVLFKDTSVQVSSPIRE